tara:strand:+ start:402 stop:605 length:204 start_codon:yes stop_codon:yes gene_type:complete
VEPEQLELLVQQEPREIKAIRETLVLLVQRVQQEKLEPREIKATKEIPEQLVLLVTQERKVNREFKV